LAGSNDEFDQLAININAMLDGIQDLTDGLRRVSQDIAHDMRTPLTRVRQKLEQAITNAKSGNGNGKILTSTVEDIDALLEAFNALLRIAQIQSGTRRAGFQAFDLSETLKHLFGDYESVAEDSGRHISAELEDAITLVGDKPLIVQMMVNLIENAIRHTPEGTAIVLRLNEAPGRIEIMVADNGPGIPEAERERVFRRFYRRDASRHTPGSGLGLSLVSAVAELHNIELRLDDNQPGLRVTLSFRPTSQL
jgi:signal transduction histidine kinase